MPDLLRLLQMLQNRGQIGQPDGPAGPVHPSILQQRNLLQGDPMAEAIFQQAYGGQDNGPEAPTYEQSRHPAIEGVTGAVGDYLDQSNFRPRNFGEGLAAGFLKGGVGAFNEGAAKREAGNAEKKAAYKAEQKAAYEQKLLAQKDYASLAKDKAGQKPPQSLADKLAEQAAMITGRMTTEERMRKELGIPRYKPEPDQPAMGEDDVDAAARIYVGGGGFPPRGALSHEGWSKFYSVVTRLVNEGADPAAAKAGMAANQSSLTLMTKQLNAVNAFEGTTLRNMDVAMNRLKKVVDTGSPFFNKPVRSFVKNVLGQSAGSQFDAALEIVRPEVGKILGGGTIGGAAIAEGMRKDMQAVIDGNANVQQLTDVMGVVRQDMTNRKTEYQKEIQNIKDALKNPFLNANRPQGATPGVSATDSGLEVVRDANGKLVVKGRQ